ncbi:MAG: hypothetical protein Q4F84_01400 [Fibrobacter sp.]|nr:hypothetical protein [Fibrobacter sp.]
MNKTVKFFMSLFAGIVITGCNVADSDNEPNAFIGEWNLIIEGVSGENSVYFGENGKCSFLTANEYNFSNDTIWLINDTNGGVQSPDTIVAKYNFDEYGTLTFERINYQDSFEKPVTFPKLICNRSRPVLYTQCGNDILRGCNFFGKWLVLSEKDSDNEISKIVYFGNNGLREGTECSFFEANKYNYFNDTILLIHEYNDITTWWNPYPDTVTANFNFSENKDTLFVECLNNQGFNGNSKFTLSRIAD